MCMIGSFVRIDREKTFFSGFQDFLFYKVSILNHYFQENLLPYMHVTREQNGA